MEEDKPFACPVPDCKMTFTNEDHLDVHKKKHEFSLSLSPSAFKSPLVDQTPTPTRFLDSSLFQDFHNDNPFDATFRRANALGIDSSIPESSSLNAGLPDPEPLSTPSITLTNEADLPLFPLRHESSAITRLKPPQKRVESINEESSDTLPFELNCPRSNSSTAEGTEDFGNARKKGVSETEQAIVRHEQSLPNGLNAVHNASVVQTPVITSIGNLTKTTATCVPTAVVVTRPSTSDVPSLSSSVSQMSVTTESVSESTVDASQPIVQLIIRLPDGRAIPVLIPNGVNSISTDTAAPATTTTPAQVEKTVSNITPKTNTTPSIAKMKLKQVLTSSHKSEQRNNRNGSSADQRTRITTNHISHSLMSSSPTSVSSLSSKNAQDSESPPTSPPSLNRSVCAGRKRREIEDDPEEKRRKSLERNRAAATRCRQKRKQWIQTLGKKADELAATNIQLQNEVNMLRNEVAQLKTMLLAHKDCPVTQQQKATGCTEIIIPTAVPLNVSAHIPANAFQERGHDLSCIPMIELMDTETSSSQSGNISDTSEISMRDR